MEIKIFTIGFAKKSAREFFTKLKEAGAKSVVGVLHPNPIQFFDRNLLPDIKFCRLADGYETGQLKVEWV